MEAANQSQGDGINPAVVGSTGRNGRNRFESGAYGELMRRAKQRPLSFSFVWRGGDFKGQVDSIDNGMRLSLRSELATVPYTAENIDVRGDLLAVVDTCAGSSEAKLLVFQGRKIMLEHEIVMPEIHGDTMATLVTHLTMLVLNTAPYLDLIAEFTSAQAAPEC